MVSRRSVESAHDDLSAGFSPAFIDAHHVRWSYGVSSRLAYGTSGTQILSTSGVSSELGETAICVLPGGASHWFANLAEAGGTLTIDTIGSTFDTVLGAFVDVCPGGGAEEALGQLVPLGRNNYIAPEDQASRIARSATHGAVYLGASMASGFDWPRQTQLCTGSCY